MESSVYDRAPLVVFVADIPPTWGAVREATLGGWVVDGTCKATSFKYVISHNKKARYCRYLI